MGELFVALVAVVLLLQGPSTCEPGSAALRLDHVVIVVRNLEEASARFTGAGFRLKEGRLHPNGLLNRHVKFRDGSGLELMSLAGEPGDRMAEDYEELLGAGEGAVYVALSVDDTEPLLEPTNELALDPRPERSGPWSFLSFSSSSPAAAVFFAAGIVPAADPDSIVTHRPAAHGLAEVWVEGGEQLGRLLLRLGATPCGAAVSPAGDVGTRWALGRGALVVVPSSRSRARVLGAVLAGDADARGPVSVLPSFWLQYR